MFINSTSIRQAGLILALCLMLPFRMLAADYYWVGNSGNWSDHNNHWATTSGGAVFHNQVPSPFDNVFFNASSFTAAGATVTLDVEAFCRNMSWTNVANNPTFFGSNKNINVELDLTITGTTFTWNQTGVLGVKGNFTTSGTTATFNHGGTINIYKSLSLNTSLNWSLGSWMYLVGSTTGNTLNFAGKSIPYLHVNGTGEWIMASALNVTGESRIEKGTFRSGGNSIKFGYRLYGQYNNPMTLDFTGTDTVRIEGEWDFYNGNSNFTMIPGTSTILFSSTNAIHFYFHGGGKTYYNVRVRALHPSSGHTIYFRHNNTLNDVSIDINSTQYVSFENNSTYRDVVINYIINTPTTWTPYSQIHSNNTFRDFTINNLYDRLSSITSYIYNSNTFRNLDFDEGVVVQFGYNQTQTIAGLKTRGGCSDNVTLQSTSGGTQATLSMPSGVTDIQFTQIRDLRGIGGGTFDANNSINLGNNTNINFLPPTAAKTFYWVGNSGNWRDPLHWSLTSGGAPQSCLPQFIDDVVFDNNSFTLANQTVNYDKHASIRHMTWTSGVVGNPTFSGGYNLTVNGNLISNGTMRFHQSGVLTLFGSLDLNSGVNWNHGNWTYFYSNNAGNLIDMAGSIFNNHVQFNGSGTWTLGSEFKLQANSNLETQFIKGNFVSGGYPVDFGYRLNAWYSGAAGSKSFNFTGTDTVRVERRWELYPDNPTLNFGSAVLKFQNAVNDHIYFYTGSKTYANVLINFTNTTNAYTTYINYGGNVGNITFNIHGNQHVNWYNTMTAGNILVNYYATNASYINTFYTEALTAGNITFSSPTVRPRWQHWSNSSFQNVTLASGMDWQIQSGVTSTITGLSAVGTCPRLINIYSGNAGSQGIINMVTGTVNADFLTLKDNRAQGGATFNTNNTVNLGNNLGWNIGVAAPATFYWVGGTGNWSDGAHWSYSSGGGPAGCVPVFKDNVVFDNNSFSAAGQIVTLDQVAAVNDMTWTSGVTGQPTFTGSPDFTINGNLVVDGGMNFNQSGQLYLLKSVSLANAATWNHNNWIFFVTDNSGNTLNFGNDDIDSQVRFDRKTGSGNPSWTLGSDFIIGNNGAQLQFYYGSFTTAGFNVNAGLDFESWTGNTRSLNFTGSQWVKMRREWRMYSGGLTLNMGSTCEVIIESNSGDYLYFRGGDKTYNKVTMINHISGGWYYHYFEGNNTYNGKVTYKSTNQNSYHQIFLQNTSVYNGGMDVYLSGINNQFYVNGGNNTFSDLKIFYDYAVPPTYGLVRMHGNNTIQDTLQIDPMVDLYCLNGYTQSVSKFVPLSTCLRRSRVRGDNGTWIMLNQASGTVNTQYITLENCRVGGGATFNAAAATIVGSVTGWNVTAEPAYNLYWVGGNGNWNDPMKWSFSSGGVGNGCVIPKAKDNAIFDGNSFTASSKTVTMNVTGECKNMLWAGSTVVPIFTGGNQLSVFGDLVVADNMNFSQNGSLLLYGSITLNSSMQWNHNNWTYFRATTTGKTIDMAGKQFLNHVEFQGNGGEWTLTNKYLMGWPYETYFYRGSFISNGFYVDFGRRLYGWSSDPRSLNFTGTDTVRVEWDWRLYPSNLTLVAGTSRILMDANSGVNFEFYGGGKTYYDVEMNHDVSGNYSMSFQDGGNTFHNVVLKPLQQKQMNINGNNTYNDFLVEVNNNNVSTTSNIYVNGSNTFNSFTLLSPGTAGPFVYLYQNNTFNNFTSAGRGTRVYLGSNRTQTVDYFQVLGTGSAPAFLYSTTSGVQGTIFKASGVICMDYVWLQDINATGSATFNAGVSSQNLGNNTGWNFSSCSGYYWVGGTGNWSDLSHWATSSGGSIVHIVLPSQHDDVWFDANSFLTSGAVVTVDIADPRCRDMNWQSAFFSPTLTSNSSNSDLNIYGSLKFTAAMAMNYNKNFVFKASSGVHQVNSGGHTLTNTYFKGPGPGSPGGTWKLVNGLSVSNNLTLEKGALLTDGQTVNTKYFNVTTSSVKSLSLGASKININSGIWDIQNTDSLSFIPGTSEIIVKGNGGNSHFHGAGLTYNNATFSTGTTLASNLLGANTFNTLKVLPGLTLSMQPGTQTISTLNATGTCNKEITIQSTVAGTQASFSKSSGTVTVNFVRLKDNSATGGASFNANLSTNLGNVSGWSFSTNPVLSVSISTTNATCPIPNNGTAKANLTGGTPPFIYQWSNLMSTDSIGGLTPGSYTVTVTDSNGCVAASSATIGQPSSYGFTVSAPMDTICNGATNGEISVSVSGAAMPVSYLWNDLSTSQSRTGLAPGTYSVTVTDANSCQGSAASAVVANQPVVLTSSVTPTSVCEGNPMAFNSQVLTNEFEHNFTGTSISNIFTKDNIAVYTQNDSLIVNAPSNGWNKEFYTNQTFARVANKTFHFRYSSQSNYNMIGWHGNSTGGTYPDMLYSFYFHTSGLQIYEDGNYRGDFNGSVPGGFSNDTPYDCKIVLKASGADYYLKKASQSTFVLIYSSTYSTETNLRLGFNMHGNGSNYLYTDNWIVNMGTSGGSGSATVSQFWNFGDGDTTSSMNPTHTYASAGTYNVTVSATDVYGCTGTSALSATVNPAANVSVTPSNPAICTGGSVSLTASGANTYSWNGIGGTPPLDQVSGARLAIGLRKLNSSYSGSAIRLRRSSDNAEANFGFSGNNLDLASIATFLGTNTGYVTVIYDQSGFGNNVTQTSAGNQPVFNAAGLNGKPSMHFTPSHNMRTNTNFPSPWTLVYAARQTGPQRGRMLTGISNNWLLGWWSGSKGQAYYEGWVSNPGGNTADNNAYVYSGAATGGGSSQLYQNGTLLFSNGNGNQGPNGIGLNTNEASEGDFTEVIVYNSVLSNANRALIENNSGSFYGIFGSSSSNTPTVTVNPTTTTTYSVIGTNTGGCSDTAIVTVTVNPIPSAVISVVGSATICPGGTVVLNASTGTGYTYQWKLNGTDISGATASSYTANATGNYTVVVTALNCSATSAPVAVTLNTLPTITCPANISVNNTSGQCGATVTFSAAASGGSPAPTVTFSPASGSFFPVGVTTVTGTATNSCGTANCTFTVTVVDNQPPVLTTCGVPNPPNVMRGTTSGGTASVVSWGALNGASQYAGTSIGTSCGENWRPFGTLCDESPNTNSQTISTKSNQNSGATWSANGGIGIGVLVVDLGSAQTINTAQVFQMFSDGKTTHLAGYYHPSTSSTAPSLSDAGWLPLFSESLIGPGAISGSNVTSPTGITFPSTSTRYVRFYARNTGIYGNGSWIETRNIKLFNAGSDVTVYATAAGCTQTATYNLPVTDNCPGATTAYSIASGSTFPIGTTPVSVIATDASGNTANCNFNVVVLDTIKPVISCPSNITVVHAPSQCGATVTFAATASDNCSATIAYSPASGSFFGLGVTTVTATATDPSGNTRSCTFTVTVTNPEIHLHGNSMTINDADLTPSVADDTDFGQPFPNVPVLHTFLIENTGTSPLTISSIGLTGLNASNFTVGGISLPVTIPVSGSSSFTVTFTAATIGVYNAVVNIGSDDCNNAGFTFAVRGEVNCQPPALTSCPGNMSLNAASGLCNATPTYSVTVSGSPAPAFTYTFSGATTGSGTGTGSGSAFNVGVTNVSIQASNPCGNVNCSFTVTVIDNQNPLLVCPGNQTLIACETVLPNFTTMATISDNCTYNATQSPAAGTAIASGATVTVTLTATDPSNNVSTCSFTVTRPNVTPTANDDSYSLCQGTSQTLNVLSNDVHPSSLPLMISSNTTVTPSQGTLVFNSGTNNFTYTAPTGFSGPVTFTYTIKANDNTQANPDNGHYYQFVSAPGICWTAARSAALGMTYQGMQGYLVTITSATENAFMFNKVGTTAWIGGSDQASEGVWRWMDGPEAGLQFSGQIKTGPCSANVPGQINYHNWGGGEPNDCGGSGAGSHAEDYAHFLSNGQWNDLPNCAGVSGYAVEFGGLGGCIPVLTSTATVTINILPAATITLSSNSPICSSDALNLSAGGGATNATWTGPNGFTSSSLTPTIANATTAASGTYTATTTNASGCSASAAIVATVVQTPGTPVSGGDQTICIGGTAGLSATSTGGNITWWNSSTGGTQVGTGSPFNVNPTSNTTYYAEGTTGGSGGGTVTALSTAVGPVEANAQTGDDRGGMMVTPTQVFLNGDQGVGRWDHNLGVQASMMPMRDGMFCDINPSGSGALYSLWNTSCNTAPNSCSNTVNSIRTMDASMTLGTTIMLSSSISLGSNIGIFSGPGFVLLAGNNAWYRIALPSGVVTTLSTSVPLPTFAGYTENWTRVWGWSETDGSNYYAVMGVGGPSSWYPITSIIKKNVVSGAETTIATYSTISDMASCIYSPWDNRVFIHWEGSSQFGGSDESLAYLNATATSGGSGTVTCISPARTPVAVVVNTPPVITCPSNISVNATSGQCQAPVTYSASATGTPTPTITYSTASGSNFPVGTTTVTATATNSCGTVSCTFTVTVVDNQAPSLTCPADIVVQNNAGVCNATVTVPAPVTSDNCSAPSIPSAPFAASSPNLSLWIDATQFSTTNGGGLSGIIDDASGFNRALSTNATYETAGFNTRPSVRYNGNQTFTNGAFTINANTYIFTTVQIIAPATNWASVFYHWNRDGGLTIEQNPLSPTSPPGGTAQYHFQTGNDNFGVEQNITYGTTYIMAAKITGGNARSFTLYRNNGGVLQNMGTSTSSSFSVPLATGQLFIGRSDAGEFPNMRMGEFIYFQGGMPVSEASVVNYLFDKWLVNNSVTLTNTFNGTSNASGTYPLGTTTVTWTATDAASNSTTCTQTVTVNAAEVDLTGNALSIADGDNTPTLADHTDYGTPYPGVPVTRTYTIYNNGTAPLQVNSIAITGPQAGNFTVSGITTPLTVSPSSFTTFNVTFVANPIGVYNATVTVNNSDCNEGVYDFAVRGEVTCLPAAFTSCPSNISVNTDPNNCNAVVSYNPSWVGEPAPSVTYTFSGATTGSGSGTGSGAVFNLGVTTVNVNIVNPCGNTNCTFTVTVTDNEAPVVTASSSLTVECDGAGNSASLNAWLSTNGGATATDNCSYTWTNNFTNLSDLCGNTGSATVTFTATDPSNNSTSTTATFTIVDTTVPTITAASDMTVECDGGGNLAALNGWLANNGGATSSDICAGITWSNNFSSLSDLCGNTGVATVTFTSTDACGNTSSTSATFTIVDTTVPTITAASDMTVECDGGGNIAALNGWLANNGGATSSDICAGVTWSNNFTSLSDLCGNTGAATVTFTSTDACGNTSSTTATFTIVDTTVPAITAASSYTAECDGAGNTAELATWLNSNGGATSSDICSGITWSNNFTSLSDLCGNTGAATVTFTSTDACGNTSSTTATFTIVDTTVPAITAASSYTAECDGAGNTAELATWLASNGGATSSDICSGITWSNNFTSLSDLCGNTGAATVTFTSTDACGNTSSTSATFTIIDTTVPAITAASSYTAECDGGGNTAELAAWLNSNGGATSSDICSGITWSNNFTSLSDLCGNTGAATVTFTSTDACGNTSSTSATFTIIDTTVPAITAASNYTAECDGGGNTAELAAWLNSNGGATSSDICSGITWSNNFTSLSDLCGNTGAATVTFTSTDACGNTSSTTATFTIVDTTVPAITAASSYTAECDGGGNTAELAAWLNSNGGATSSDICSGVTWSNNFTTLSDLCGATGAATVTFTATDDCGNASSVTATFTIQDVTAPAITCPAVVYACYESTTDIGTATGTDACSGVIITHAPNYTSSNEFSVGVSGNQSTTVTWTATDDCGNLTTCTQEVNRNSEINATITETDIPYWCQGCLKVLTITSSGGTGNHSYLWSNGATTASITVAPGVYTCTVTDAYGTVSGFNCNRTFTYNLNPNCTNGSVLSTLTLIANREIHLHRTGVVGGIGIRCSSGKVKLNDGTGVNGYIVSPNVYMSGVSGMGSGGSSSSSGSPASCSPMAPGMVGPITYSTITASVPPFNVSTSTSNAVYHIPNGSIVTLTGSTYGKIKVGKNSKVTFSGQNVVNMKELQTGDNVEIMFTQCTEMRICNKLHIGKSNKVNLGNVEVTWYVGGCANTAGGSSSGSVSGGSGSASSGASSASGVPVTIHPGHAQVHSGTTFKGNIYVYAASLANPSCPSLPGSSSASGGSGGSNGSGGGSDMDDADGSSNSNLQVHGTCTKPTFMEGMYLAGSIHSSKNVSFVPGTNCNDCTPSYLRNASEELMAEEQKAGNMIEVMPNPFRSLTTFRFKLNTTEKATLSVYDMNGKLIGVLFDGTTKAGEEMRVDFEGKDLASGIYLYQLVTPGSVETGKVSLIKE